jgi:plastocyanin domain-containing protein
MFRLIKAIAFSGALIASGCGGTETATSHQTTDEVHETPTASTAPVTASTGADGVQEATIQVGGAYEPSSIVVKQGQPLRLKFHRADDKNCGGEVVFPALNIRKTLPAGQTTVIDLPAQKSGELAFACGMDMMKGKVIVQ